MMTGGNAEAKLKTGLLHFQRGEFDAAEPPLRELAAQNLAIAMYYLGAICRLRDHDNDAALQWFRSGAAQGQTNCMFELGTWAFTQQDFDSARYWLGRAAEAGAVNAMLNLGSVLLISGDREAARKWWQRAARQGNGSEKAQAKLILQQNFP
jgi:hypothetical protein